MWCPPRRPASNGSPPATPPKSSPASNGRCRRPSSASSGSASTTSPAASHSPRATSPGSCGRKATSAATCCCGSSTSASTPSSAPPPAGSRPRPAARSASSTRSWSGSRRPPPKPSRPPAARQTRLATLSAEVEAAQPTLADLAAKEQAALGRAREAAEWAERLGRIAVPQSIRTFAERHREAQAALDAAAGALTEASTARKAAVAARQPLPDLAGLRAIRRAHDDLAQCVASIADRRGDEAATGRDRGAAAGPSSKPPPRRPGTRPSRSKRCSANMSPTPWPRRWYRVNRVRCATRWSAAFPNMRRWRPSPTPSAGSKNENRPWCGPEQATPRRRSRWPGRLPVSRRWPTSARNWPGRSTLIPTRPHSMP